MYDQEDLLYIENRESYCSSLSTKYEASSLSSTSMSGSGSAHDVVTTVSDNGGLRPGTSKSKRQWGGRRVQYAQPPDHLFVDNL
jgi:hypothetical protein